MSGLCLSQLSGNQPGKRSGIRQSPELLEILHKKSIFNSINAVSLYYPILKHFIAFFKAEHPKIMILHPFPDAAM